MEGDYTQNRLGVLSVPKTPLQAAAVTSYAVKGTGCLFRRSRISCFWNTSRRDFGRDKLSPPMREDDSTAARLGRAAGRAYIKLGLPTRLSKHAEDMAWRAIWIAVAILVIGTISALYSVLDAAGYISHTRETLICVHPSWLVGESRTCYSVPLQPEYAARHKAWDVTHRVGCGSGLDHYIKVTFHGRTERPELRAKFGVSWKCVRRKDYFECYSLD